MARSRSTKGVDTSSGPNKAAESGFIDRSREFTVLPCSGLVQANSVARKASSRLAFFIAAKWWLKSDNEGKLAEVGLFGLLRLVFMGEKDSINCNRKGLACQIGILLLTYILN